MELDIDPQGASSMFFPAELLDKLLWETVRPPLLRGRLKFDALAPRDRGKMHFEVADDGELKLWLVPRQDARGNYEVAGEDRYGMGADISAGTGATNSCLSIVDRTTREKVGELARPDLDPSAFADLALAVATFFNEAYLIWEMNGPGGTFGKRLTDQGYRNIYYRQEEMGLEHKLSKGLIPGWFASPGNKLLLFREYVRALSSGYFINRSRESVTECRQYVYLPNGSVGNARAQTATDPSGARQNHGDRPTADALANKTLGPETAVVVVARDLSNPYTPPENAPWGSLAWRRQKWLDEQQVLKGDWGEGNMKDWKEDAGISGWN
jgi:hypothetical protein